MAKKKCNFCGEFYAEEFEGTLNNGSPACPQCVEDEENWMAKKADESK